MRLLTEFACALVLFSVGGCAAGDFTGICAYQQLGQNEAGVPYLAVHCQPSAKK